MSDSTVERGRDKYLLAASWCPGWVLRSRADERKRGRTGKCMIGAAQPCKDRHVLCDRQKQSRGQQSREGWMMMTTPIMMLLLMMMTEEIIARF